MTHLGQIVLQVGIWVNGPLSSPNLSLSPFMALDTCIRHKGQLELLLELLERERASLREREKQREEGGWGVSDLSHKETKVTQMGHRQATAGEKNDGHQCGWSERKRERGKETTND